MNPFLIWLEENLVLVLGVAFALSALAVVTGGLAAWRCGRRLVRPPRPIIRFALSLLLVAAGCGGVRLFLDGLRTVVPAARAQQSMLGEPAPPLVFSQIDSGVQGRLTDFRGRVVLVNLWATWCPPCREEMPALDRLQIGYADRGLVVLHISDEEAPTVARYLQEQSMTTLHGIAQPIPWPEFGRPTTYVVDRQGVVRDVIVGARTYEGFERMIQAHL